MPAESSFSQEGVWWSVQGKVLLFKHRLCAGKQTLANVREHAD